jgi:hypothetical protein
MNPRLLPLLVLISTVATVGRIHAATRLALVGGDGNSGVENVLDTATALLSQDTDLQLLDRAEVGRVLREQELSLAGLVRAESAVKAGQLLHADLFAVLEGTLTNETGSAPSLGLVVFDAKNGARYADMALRASNVLSAASASAAGVRAAAEKSRRSPQDLHTVGLLLVRNADLPRQFDSLCDTVGLLLERELTASPGIAVLERRRLEQVNKERGLGADAEGNRLLASLRMMQLDIGREGAGLRGSLALVAVDGSRAPSISASVATRDAAALAHLLAERTERLWNVPLDGNSVDRAAEAARFHREYLLLCQHRDYIPAVRALDAAMALRPEEANWRQEMAWLLPFAAIEFIGPGRQNDWRRPLTSQPASGDLASGLALGERGADLLLDLSRDAAQRAKPGEELPQVLTRNYYKDPLSLLLSILTGVTAANPVSADEIAALFRKERRLRMEVVEPFLRMRSVDRASFATYSFWISQWFSGYYPSRLPLEQRLGDHALVLRHWLELSHRLNPGDGSGSYAPVWNPPGLAVLWRDRGDEIEGLRRTLEQDQDPVIRLYARAARARAAYSLSLNGSGRPSDETFAAEREFRLYAQDLLAHSQAAKPNPLCDHVWRAVVPVLDMIRNHEQGWKEYVDACRFAFAQEDIEPILFFQSLAGLDDQRHPRLPEQLEVLNGALKLILEKPGAYPNGLPGLKRSDVIADLRQRRDHLAAELAGASANTPGPEPWKRKVCLLDLAIPLNGFGWLFKPVAQDGQAFAAALGVREWGVSEDSLQLVRVPLEGGPPSCLGRARITGIDWVNRAHDLAGEQQRRLADNSFGLDVVRSACVGAGCYFAATCSGVFIFPTNGGRAFRLGAADGLPSEDTDAVAFLDGKLYIGLGQLERDGYLAAYEPATRKISVLASSRRSERLSPFDDQPPFCTRWLAADPARHRLLMVVGATVTRSNKLPPITACMGIWAYLPSAGQYRRLAPLCLPTLPRAFVPFMWSGAANASTLAVKDTNLLALFDPHKDRLLSACGFYAQKTDEAFAMMWRRPSLSNQLQLPNGPFFILDGWFYSARPFQRTAFADGRTEALPPLRTDYPIQLRESLQLLDDGKHVLAADQYSLWLLELKPESPQASPTTAVPGSDWPKR